MTSSALAKLILGAVGLALAWAGASQVSGGGAPGDVNCSEVNSIDAVVVLQYSAALTSTLACQSQADVNGDGSVDAIDASLILQFVAGLIDHLGPGLTPTPTATRTPTPPSPPTPTHTALPTASGELVIYHIDVGQGDAALIISPTGETAMIDDGRWNNCDNTVDFLSGIGIASIDYHFASHYDADHIGCLNDMAAAGIAVDVACYDRGTEHEPSTQTYQDYAATCGDRRQTATRGQVVTLGGGLTITVVDLNGAGVQTSEENALGLVLRLTFGIFDEVFAGDLPGESPNIESVVGPEVGDVDVYKVNHHGSQYSSTDPWLDAIAPEVAVLSVGNNSYGHPTAAALGRLHARSVPVYWTETGSGVAPDPTWDKVGGTIEISVRASGTYGVSGEGFADSFVSK